MTKKSKGRGHERIIAELFRRAGWAVHLVQPAVSFNPKTGRYYSRPQDIFGADILAIKGNRVLLFAQVTCDTAIGRKIRKFQELPFPWDLVRVVLFQARKKNGRWTYRAFIVDQRDHRAASSYFLEDIFGGIFWENRHLFRAEGNI